MGWDLYSILEYNEIRAIQEKNALLDPQRRDKYLREKAKREAMEKKVRQIENRVQIMW